MENRILTLKGQFRIILFLVLTFHTSLFSQTPIYSWSDPGVEDGSFQELTPTSCGIFGSVQVFINIPIGGCENYTRVFQPDQFITFSTSAYPFSKNWQSTRNDTLCNGIPIIVDYDVPSPEDHVIPKLYNCELQEIKHSIPNIHKHLGEDVFAPKSAAVFLGNSKVAVMHHDSMYVYNLEGEVQQSMELGFTPDYVFPQNATQLTLFKNDTFYSVHWMNQTIQSFYFPELKGANYFKQDQNFAYFIKGKVIVWFDFKNIQLNTTLFNIPIIVMQDLVKLDSQFILLIGNKLRYYHSSGTFIEEKTLTDPGTYYKIVSYKNKLYAAGNGSGNTLLFTEVDPTMKKFQLDIGIVSSFIQASKNDTFFIPNSNPKTFLYYSILDSIQVTVRNTGKDTIHQFSIRSSGKKYCVSPNDMLSRKNIHLVPGEEMKVHGWVKRFSTNQNPYEDFHNCVRVLSPNSQPDGNWSNDYLCSKVSTNTPVSNPDIMIFPNPTIDYCMIQSDINISKIFIYNITGNMLLQENIYSNPQTIDLSKLDPGVYWISAISKDQIVSKKLVKL